MILSISLGYANHNCFRPGYLFQGTHNPGYGRYILEIHIDDSKYALF